MDNFSELYYREDEELKDLASSYDYERVLFIDRVPEFVDTWKEEDLGNGIIKHEQMEGIIYQKGVPLDYKHLGQLDLGIFMLYLQVKDLQDLMQNLMIEVAALKGAALNNMPNNIFFVNFKDLKDWTIVEGWYDEANARVVS